MVKLGGEILEMFQIGHPLKSWRAIGSWLGRATPNSSGPRHQRVWESRGVRGDRHWCARSRGTICGDGWDWGLLDDGVNHDDDGDDDDDDDDYHYSYRLLVLSLAVLLQHIRWLIWQQQSWWLWPAPWGYLAAMRDHFDGKKAPGRLFFWDIPL